MSCIIQNLDLHATAIICGSNKCECDDNGPELAFNNEEYFDVSSRPDWNTDQNGFIKWMEDKKIIGGCCSCSH